MNKEEVTTILGIDPGLRATGYGILEQGEGLTHKGSGIYPPCKLVEAGVITTDPKMSVSERLRTIYHKVKSLIETYTPNVMAVEEVYLSSNQKTAMAISQVRGVILLAGDGLEIKNYTPLQVKHRITGYGKASKEQMRQMVKRLLTLPTIPKSDHTADALGIAICFAMEGKLTDLMTKKS